LCGLSYRFRGRESNSNTSENPIKRTILFYAKGNSRPSFVAGLDGFGSESDDQLSKDSAIRFSPASLSDSVKFVSVSEALRLIAFCPAPPSGPGPDRGRGRRERERESKLAYLLLTGFDFHLTFVRFWYI
jgi:hypothetical protein